MALHFWWRNRFVAAHHSFNTQLSELKSQQQQFTSQTLAEQQALFNSMIEGVLVLDSSDHIRIANQSVLALFEITGDIRGKTVMEALRLHEIVEVMRRLPDKKQVLGVEITLPGVEIKIVQVNASAIFDREGKQKGTILVFHDLTRLKQLENTRQEFVANVSHELRTPLSLIKGYVETLNDGAKDQPEIAAKFLQTIQRNADRLTFLIEDLLTISQLESGQIILNPRPLQLHAAAQRVVEDLESKAQRKKVEITNRIPETVVVDVDPDRLQQVFSNLIDNAIKYGRPEGSVSITAKPSDDNIEVAVIDDGPGIPPDALERIFERFYRVDKARSREQGGTGLGLSIVKHIVQCHGGKVWATSESGKGTVFYFTLPKATGKP